MVLARRCAVWPAVGVLARPLAVDGIIDAVIAEDADELADVGEPRQILQRQRLVGQQRGDHQRQRGVLGAGNRDRALQLGRRRES